MHFCYPYPEEELRHLTICDKVMREKGTLDITALQCVLNGAPCVGKSTLLSRLVPRSIDDSSSHQITDTEKLNVCTVSTGVAETVIQVTVKPATAILAKSTQPGQVWEQLPLDVEAISLLKAIVRALLPQKHPQLPSSVGTESTDMPNSSGVTQLPSASQTESVDTSAYSATNDSVAAAEQQSTPVNNGPGSLFQFGKRSSQESLESRAIPNLPDYISPLKFFQEALRSEKWSIVDAVLENTTLLYLTDTGGQLVFQELLSALIAGSSVFFVVFKLIDKLNQKYQVQYIQSPSKKAKPYLSRFTVKEALLQSLASISCTCSYISRNKKELVPIKPKVVLIGTHKDLASEDQIHTIQRELKEILKDMEYYKNDTLVFASPDEPVVTVNNLSSNEEDTQKVRNIVERIASHSSFRISTPVPWLVFGHALKYLSSRVLSYEKCLSIAKECGIDDEEELDEALWFLHTKLGVLRHFQSIPELRKIVIQDPQLVFDKITEMISSTFKFDKAGLYVAETFQQKGIFPAKFIEEISSQCDELLTSAKLVKLLEHLHIIAPIIDGTGHIIEYFMPCVLNQASSITSTDHTSNPIAPLLVAFRCGYCPKGIFAALVVYLLSKQSSTSLSWCLKKNGVSRDRVTFSIGKEHHTVSVTTHLTHLEVSFKPTSKVSFTQWQIKLHEMCDLIRKNIEEGIRTVSKTLHYTIDFVFWFGFYCNLSSCPQQKNHPAICYEQDPCMMNCNKTEMDNESDVVLTPFQCVWFGHPVVSCNK